MSRTDPVFDKLTMLERLEEIREELDELGITSLDDLNKRIDALEAEVGDTEGEDSSGADGPV